MITIIFLLIKRNVCIYLHSTELKLNTPLAVMQYLPTRGFDGFLELGFLTKRSISQHF